MVEYRGNTFIGIVEYEESEKPKDSRNGVEYCTYNPNNNRRIVELNHYTTLKNLSMAIADAHGDNYRQKINFDVPEICEKGGVKALHALSLKEIDDLEQRLFFDTMDDSV